MDFYFIGDLLKLKLIFLLCLLSLFLLSGCTQVGEVNELSNEENSQNTTYSLEEVSLHSTPQDCWMIFDNKVYDITNFISFHPGGNIITEWCGKDATIVFSTKAKDPPIPHSASATTRREQYNIGELND